MRKFNIKNSLALGLAAVLTLSAAFPSFAAPSRPEDMDDETWIRLQDNTLEYSEIDNLVKIYNPSIRLMEDAIMQGLDTLDEIQGDMYWGIVNLRDMADDMRDAGKGIQEEGKELPEEIYNATVKPLVEGYKQAAAGYDQAADAYQKTANEMKKTKEKQLKTLDRTQISPVRKQIASGVKSMVIGYNQMRVQKEMLEKLVELYTAMANSSNTQTQLGMGTSLSAQTAAVQLVSAQNNLANLNTQMASMKATICRMTGWPYDANPDILPVPSADPSYSASINLEADKIAAIGNNYTLISMRNTTSEKSTVKINAKLRKDEEGDQKVSITIENLYQDLKAKELQLQAAETAFKKAEMTKDSASRMLELGMMGQTEYLSAQVGYYQQKAARDSADMNLLQAQETYYYAVNGLAKLAGE